jgi:hypothetical protein
VLKCAQMIECTRCCNASSLAQRRARIIVYAPFAKHVGKPDLSALARWESAYHDERAPMSPIKLWSMKRRLRKRDWRVHEIRASSPCGLQTRDGSQCQFGRRNSFSIALPGGATAGDLPKNCHLLPSTAILEPRNRYTRCNRFDLILGPQSSVLGLHGWPAILRRGSQNRGRADRSLGGMLP